MSITTGIIAGSAFVLAVQGIFVVILLTSIDNSLQDIFKSLENIKKGGEE